MFSFLPIRMIVVIAPSVDLEWLHAPDQSQTLGFKGGRRARTPANQRRRHVDVIARPRNLTNPSLENRHGVNQMTPLDLS